MVETDYKINGKSISYTLLDNNYGYIIYLDDEKWITQTTDIFIPYKRDTMNDSVIAHIEQLMMDCQENN